MMRPLPRLLTIAPDRPFLEVLADAVLAGFPRAAGRPAPAALARWTILLPTRRAVRELERILFARSGGQGLLLPAIRPLGDLDEEMLDGPSNADDAEVAPAISPAGQLLLLVDLVDDWARENPHTRLAQDMAAAPHQAAALALSLQDLLDSLDTEEIDASRIPALYDLENARHREAILELLAIARERFPQRLAGLDRTSAAARRAELLRREARRLAAGGAQGPVIAAGSTGTIPATRDLLDAISRLPEGAVILPGLDLEMDEASWSAVGPVHPQYAMKQLLAALDLSRAEVELMDGGAPGARSWLAGEIMRPADTSDRWGAAILSRPADLAAALAGIELVEAQHRQEEAQVIAIMLRQALETPGRTASLVTPDRSLARRVKAELRRWDIAIDDSGGEPLLRFGAAALLHLLADAALRGFAPASLAALMRHDLCRLGRAPEQARRCASIVEMAALRREPVPARLADLVACLAARRPQAGRDLRLHPGLERLSPSDWDDAIAFAADLVRVLSPLPLPPEAGFTGQVQALVDALEALAGKDLRQDAVGAALYAAIDMALADAALLRRSDFARSAAILLHLLRATALRPPAPRAQRLSILGLLEARLMRPDLVVMGGLNEGAWPSQPDAGPWLNRPMRDTLAMQQPERAIGQTAHDFVQAFGAGETKLVWSRRIGDAPAVPSRWILRLQMILKAAGQSARLGKESPWLGLAAALAAPAAVTPLRKPRPRPPLAARPVQLSVTAVERLIRDPYAVYARHVLKLTPLDPIAAAPDPARRGTVIHDIVGRFLLECPEALPEDALQRLVALGRARFAAELGDPAVYSFWWPRFERMARWLVAREAEDRAGMTRVLAETSGATRLEIAGAAFDLTCRADRLDLLRDGTARIADYKTGAVPSAKEVAAGLAPQLTLQAAILQRGGFREVAARPVSALRYIKLSGGDPGGEIKGPEPGTDLAALIADHLAGLISLVAAYRNPAQAYLPRVAMKREDDRSDYDHLSRYREWALGGDAA